MSYPSIFTAMAHSGRTDANGGHNDNINGGYHYHHGYSAHQHTNGICPYEYDNRTDRSSSTSSVETTAAVVSKTVTPNNSSDISGWLILSLYCIPAVIFFYVRHHLKKEKSQEDENFRLKNQITKLQEENHRQEKQLLQLKQQNQLMLDKESKKLKEQLSNLEEANRQLSELLESYREDNVELENIALDFKDEIGVLENQLKKIRTDPFPSAGLTYKEIQRIAKIPDGVVFDEYNLPHYRINPDVESNMHVYISDKGFCYHRKEGCSGATRPMHLFLAASSFSPCHKCIPRRSWNYKLPDWYYRYLQLIALKDHLSVPEPEPDSDIRYQLKDPMVDDDPDDMI